MNQETLSASPSRAFMSYSHDSDEHRDWVLDLASRLRANGVDICLDRWDVHLGGNLARFMERAADTEYRVIAVVSEIYAGKADERQGGAGVEAQMLSARLYENIDSDRVIPILRNNPEGRLPAFLLGRRWLDFRDDAQIEAAYEELLRELHGRHVDVAPALGANPFDGKTDHEARLAIRNTRERWRAPGDSGEVEFVYTQNSGNYTLGSGECQFTLALSNRGRHSAYAYRGADIQHVAVIEDVTSRLEYIDDVSVFDTSSRVVDVGPGDVIVLHNRHGYWALVEILDIDERMSLNRENVIRFRYHIQTNRTPDFSDLLTQDAG